MLQASAIQPVDTLEKQGWEKCPYWDSYKMERLVGIPSSYHTSPTYPLAGPPPPLTLRLLA